MPTVHAIRSYQVSKLMCPCASHLLEKKEILKKHYQPLQFFLIQSPYKFYPKLIKVAPALLALTIMRNLDTNISTNKTIRSLEV